MNNDINRLSFYHLSQLFASNVHFMCGNVRGHFNIMLKDIIIVYTAGGMNDNAR